MNRDHVLGFVAGSESAARTIEAVAVEWRGLPEGKAAVQRFAALVAQAVREAADKVAEVPR